MIERSELITPGPAEALAGLLDVAAPADGVVPLMWHWLYLLERPRQLDLGPDGHPVRGVVPAPPGPGRRRMWAGGQVRSLAPLRVGEQATRTSRVLRTEEKSGRSGQLTFVTVGHTVEQRGEVVVEERQDIVYRDGAVPVPGPVRVAEPAEERPAVPVQPGEWSVPVSPTLLFGFSALTYNAHRIHYDRDYARDVEGYPGLVVHGPLQAMVMAEAARAQGRRTEPGTTLDYRLIAPLYDDQGLVVSISENDDRTVTAVRDCAGRATAQGIISP